METKILRVLTDVQLVVTELLEAIEELRNRSKKDREQISALTQVLKNAVQHFGVQSSDLEEAAMGFGTLSVPRSRIDGGKLELEFTEDTCELTLRKERSE